MGSGMIIDNAAQVENISYPALDKAIRLEEIVKETKKIIFDAIYEDNTEILENIDHLSGNLNEIINQLTALEPNSELTAIQQHYTEYQAFGRKVVHNYIVKGVTDNIQEEGKSLAKKSDSINQEIYEYRSKKYDEFSFALAKIRKQSSTFKSAFAVAGIILILIVIFTIIQTQKTFRRIGEVVNDAQLLAKGDIDRIIENSETDEIGVLKNAFESMRISLKDYISNLDRKVQQRTQQLEQSKNEITNILNSIEQGIFTFNSDLSVNESHSLKAEEIFNTSRFKDSELAQLMGASEKDLENLSQWTSMVTSLIFAEKQWKKYVKLAPIQEIREEIDGEEHIIKIDYRLIKENKETSKIMVLASDITEQRRAEAELAESERENSLVTSRVMAIINHPTEEVAIFLDSTKNIIDDMTPLRPNQILENKDKLFRDAHTQKGHGGTLGFDELALHLGIIENNLSSLTPDEHHKNGDNIQSRWNFTIKNCQLELDKIVKLKNNFRSHGGNNDIHVPKELYRKLIDLAEKSPPDIEEISTAISLLNSKRFNDYAKKYQKLIDKYCEEYDKDIGPLCIEGSDDYLSNDIIQKIDGAIVHLVRNAMDHGIEEDEIRFSLEKPQGQIRITYTRSDSCHIFNISDNGGGIPPNIIAKKAIKKSIISDNDIASMNDHEIIQLIFHPGFSTKDKVSNISGRGVGMDAVKSIIEELNGNIEVVSRLGEGSSFRLKIPL